MKIFNGVWMVVFLAGALLIQADMGWSDPGADEHPKGAPHAKGDKKAGSADCAPEANSGASAIPDKKDQAEGNDSPLTMNSKKELEGEKHVPCTPADAPKGKAKSSKMKEAPATKSDLNKEAADAQK